jgi:hypothetical protein
MTARRTLDEQQAPPASFHDCHVVAIGWQRDAFRFCLELDYILAWIEPARPGDGYRFRLCEARLELENANDPRVMLDWSAAALDLEISSMAITDQRATPYGAIERCFTIECGAQGVITVWATGYRLVLLGEPFESLTPSPASRAAPR